MHVDPLLRRAWRAATRGDGDEALDALLDAWRATRHPAIADALDAVAARMQGRPRLLGADAASYVTVCTANAVELGEILDGTATDHGLALRIVDTLLQRPADPRAARAVLDALSAPRATSASSLAHTRAAWLLTVVADVRLLPRIRALRAALHAPWAAGVLADTERHLAALQPPPALSMTATEILAALVAGDPAPAPDAEAASEAVLLAAVEAARDDDAPRLVYADWLSDRGDPRGELIVLQCARAATGAPPSEREEELVVRHGRVWLGPLEPFVARAGARFSRGFLDGLRLRRALPAALGSDPRLATVTTLDVARTTALDSLVLLLDDAELPSLRVLETRLAREVADVAALTGTTAGRRLSALQIALFGTGREELPSVDALSSWLASDAPRGLDRLTLAGDASTVTLARTAAGAVEISVTVGSRELRREILFDLLRRQLGERYTIHVDKPVPPR